MSSSSKRTADHLDGDQPPPKKIHPFFTKERHVEPSTAAFQWLEPLGPTGSCLYAVNLHPTLSTKVAAFDLDGTIIKSDFSESWEWWRTLVPTKLRDVVKDGYTLVIISNQALKPQAIRTWKTKISRIAAAKLDELTEVTPIVDKSSSFFVGDAAGRQYAGNKRDFSSTDRKWAHNVGITFFTPEEYFLNLPPHKNFTLPGFNVASLPSDRSKPPFADNTNRNVATRKFYINIGKALDIPVRCFYFTAPLDLAWHNNLYRAYNLPPSVAATEPQRTLIPFSAFVSFRDNFEEPALDEGFDEIKTVNWVFNGSEQDRTHWSMWLQIDGK
ncbi:hypothetical protein H0H93_012896 [Arthromyces matolae]|nr:hypothetical protein H0H93_012896 [Arthromyces matolae]